MSSSLLSSRRARRSLAILAALSLSLVSAQAGAQPRPAPLPSSGVGGQSPQRVPDRVWSTQHSGGPAVAAPPNGVVVMAPNVVLGWGGLPPSGPVGQPPAAYPGQTPWRRAPVPVGPGGLRPPAGTPSPAPGTLHPWRSP